MGIIWKIMPSLPTKFGLYDRKLDKICNKKKLYWTIIAGISRRRLVAFSVNRYTSDRMYDTCYLTVDRNTNPSDLKNDEIENVKP